jgi:hypothetical protein
MELSADFYWVIPLAVFIGTGLAAYFGYKQKSRSSSVVSGSAIVDSNVGYELVKEVRRLADAAEEMQEQMKKTAQTEDIRAVIANELRAELNKQRKK